LRPVIGSAPVRLKRFRAAPRPSVQARGRCIPDCYPRIPTEWTVTVRGVEDPWNAGLYAGVYVTCAKTDLP
jgi:hypothetical protein